jgi:hypothetical protein
MTLQPSVGPWSRYSVSYSFTQSAGLLGRGCQCILHKTIIPLRFRKFCIGFYRWKLSPGLVHPLGKLYSIKTNAVSASFSLIAVTFIKRFESFVLSCQLVAGVLAFRSETHAYPVMMLQRSLLQKYTHSFCPCVRKGCEKLPPNEQNSLALFTRQVATNPNGKQQPQGQNTKDR